MSSSPTPRRLQLEYHQISSINHVYNSYTPSTPSTSLDSTQREHPITAMVMTSPPSWAIHYHQIQENQSRNGSYIMQFKIPLNFGSTETPLDPYGIKLLQECVGSNGSVVYLPSSTIKSLICLWNYMNLLIKKGKSVDEKCNAQYIFQDDQWFNLTAHDTRRTPVNAGMKYHRPQIIPGTPLLNSTSHPSPAPMKSPIHLELKDHSFVGSAEPESNLESEDLLQLDSISVSSQATCSIET